MYKEPRVEAVLRRNSGGEAAANIVRLHWLFIYSPIQRNGIRLTF